MSRLLKIFALLIVLGGASAFGQGIVFKIPSGVLPMDWKSNGLKGFLMLDKDSPAGLFIASPNDGESIAQLRERAAKVIAPMIVSDTKNKDSISFEIKSIPVHQGDVGESGKYYFFKGEKSSLQILFYERQSGSSMFLYGYFASRENDKKSPKMWAEETGKGVKLLDKFVKSFSK